MGKLKSTQEKASVTQDASVLHLRSSSETKCYNFKDCYPLYIHTPVKNKTNQKCMPLYFRTEKHTNKKKGIKK